MCSIECLEVKHIWRYWLLKMVNFRFFTEYLKINSKVGMRNEKIWKDYGVIFKNSFNNAYFQKIQKICFVQNDEVRVE